MQTADTRLQGLVHRNAARIQAGLDRMLDHKAVQIDGAQFRLKPRFRLEGENEHAYGLVLIGRDERGEWLPCHC